MIVETIVGAVLLLSGSCPAYAPDTVQGCAYYWEDPPVVYVQEGLSPYHHEWVFQHEIGHIVASRRPGASAYDEQFANHYGTCHTPHPRWWRIGRKCWRWGVMP